MSSHERAIQRALTDVDREVRVWDGDPLPRADLASVASAFKRGVGDPTDTPGVRAAPPADIGVFAAEHGAVLYEFDDDPDHGAVVGYPAGERRWAPVVLCVAGADRAADLVEAFVAAASEATGDEVVRP